jgi:hypothetical protein
VHTEHRPSISVVFCYSIDSLESANRQAYSSIVEPQSQFTGTLGKGLCAPVFSEGVGYSRSPTPPYRRKKNCNTNVPIIVVFRQSSPFYGPSFFFEITGYHLRCLLTGPERYIVNNKWTQPNPKSFIARRYACFLVRGPLAYYIISLCRLDFPPGSTDLFRGLVAIVRVFLFLDSSHLVSARPPQTFYLPTG